MSTPTAEERREVFDALVGNGLDFFERSARELRKEQKFAVAHFATGLELVLKARLFHEHWSLIGSSPQDTAWSSVKAGTAHTVAASDLCKAITNTVGTSLTHERDSFSAIFKHRNRVLHWAPQDELLSTVAEQCLAWYHLRRLMLTTWQRVFERVENRIEDVDRLFREQRAYLTVKFEKLERTLRSQDSAGLLVHCSSCTFRSGVVESEGGLLRLYDCGVCGYTAIAIRTPAGFSERRPAELLREFAAGGAEAGHCGECFDSLATVVTVDGDFVCVECGAQFPEHATSRCESCEHLWFGWNSEHSYYGGCEHCDGRRFGGD